MIFKWINKIRTFDRLLEENKRLKGIIDVESHDFFLQCSRREFMKKVVYWKNCMIKYRSSEYANSGGNE